jgi:hypothetical protein
VDGDEPGQPVGQADHREGAQQCQEGVGLGVDADVDAAEPAGDQQGDAQQGGLVADGPDQVEPAAAGEADDLPLALPWPARRGLVSGPTGHRPYR